MLEPPTQEFVEEYDTVIVGAGFAGLGLGIQLLRSGEGSFVILERADDVGGTWRDNTYPGVACDVPSHLYSFSFRPKPDWSRVFSPGPEIWEYLREAAREENVLPHVRLSTEMQHCRWDAEAQRWFVRTSKGVYVGRFLVLAAGHLADERMPPIPGADSFTGDLFHSARWDHSVSLAGKRVGVVGSGASAIQLLPRVAELADQVVLFQRSAPWIIPRRDRAYTAAEKRMFERDPSTREALRTELFWTLEGNYAARRQVEPFLSNSKALARTHLANQVPDAELRAKLTPDYELGCKRVLNSNEFYPALCRSNVTLEASALAQIDGNRAISVDGNGFELDTLIFATGFEATEPPFAPYVTGKDGHSLAEHWARGLRALDSATVPGFPNLFILNGPNTGLGHNSVVYVIESQLSYVLSAMAHLRQQGLAVAEATVEAESQYVDEVRGRSAGTVWLQGGCKSWYVDPRTGELTIIWPDFAHAFRDSNSRFDAQRYDLSPAHS